jgi:hypothetical protein
MIQKGPENLSILMKHLVFTDFKFQWKIWVGKHSKNTLGKINQFFLNVVTSCLHVCAQFKADIFSYSWGQLEEEINE